MEQEGHLRSRIQVLNQQEVRHWRLLGEEGEVNHVVLLEVEAEEEEEEEALKFHLQHNSIPHLCGLFVLVQYCFVLASTLA